MARKILEKGKKKKDKKSAPNDALTAGLVSIAQSLSAPVEINIEDSRGKRVSIPMFEEFDISDRVSSTVEKLMMLEGSILAKLKSALNEDDFEFAEVLRSRVEQVKKRIDKALDTK